MEFAVEEQEHHEDSQNCCQGERARCRACRFELPAVFDAVAFGESYGRVDGLLDVVDNAPDVASRDVCRNYQFSLDVFARYRVRTADANHFSNFAERHFSTVGSVDECISHVVGSHRFGVADSQNQVEAALSFVDVGKFCAGEGEFDKSVKFVDGDAVASHRSAIGAHLQLRRFRLLFDRDVDESFDAGDVSLDAVAEHIHFADVGAEEFDGNGGACARQHVVDAVTERLTYRSGDARDGSHATAHVVEHLFAAAVAERKLHVDFGAVSGLRVFVEFATSGAARCGGHFRNL